MKRTRHVILRTNAQASAVKLACGALLALGNDGAGTAAAVADGTPAGQRQPTPSPVPSTNSSADAQGALVAGIEETTGGPAEDVMAAVMQQQSLLLLRTSDMMLEIRPGQNARHVSGAANPDPNKGHSGTASSKAGALHQSAAPLAEPAANSAGGESKGALRVTRAGRVMLHIPLHDSRITDFAPETAPAAKTQHKKRSVS